MSKETDDIMHDVEQRANDLDNLEHPKGSEEAARIRKGIAEIKVALARRLHFLVTPSASPDISYLWLESADGKHGAFTCSRWRGGPWKPTYEVRNLMGLLCVQGFVERPDDESIEHMLGAHIMQEMEQPDD